MLKHYIVSSFRYLLRNKWITIINVVGLTLGITISILIGLYIKNEISYDRSFKLADRIFRLESFSADYGRSTSTSSAYGPDLKNSLAAIKSVLRVQFQDNLVLRKDDKYFTIPKLTLADSTFFDFFDQSWIYGKPEGALNKPNSLVITDEVSKKIFGEINPIGLTISSQSGRSIFTITGVIKKRYDSHIHYDALLSLTTRNIRDSTILNTYSTHQWLTYFILENNSDIKTTEDQIYSKTLDLIQDKRDDKKFRIILNPLKDIYFTKDINDFGSIIKGNYNLVRIFMAIAILIILIACINFINLSTAKAIKRAKDVSIRKVVGSKRSSLIAKFLSESFSISFISTILGVSIAEFLLPFFNNLIGKQTSITYFDNPYTIPILIGVVIATGFLAGLYPAYYISSYKAINVIKGEMFKGKKSLGFRRGLIIFQFLISVILVNSSILIYKQLNYAKEKDLGFEKERIVGIDIPGAILSNRNIVKEKLLQNPEIINVSFSYTIPGSNTGNYEEFKINNTEVSTNVFSIDPAYIDTYGIKLIAGRNFDDRNSSDSISSCIINETLSKKIGLTNILDESFQHDSWYITVFPVNNFKIIGIVKDFHFKSFRTPIEPLVLGWNPNWFNFINIKIATGKIAPAMKIIKKTLEEFAPGAPLEFQFIDDNFDKMYKSDEKMGQILIYFTLLAIIIGVLGLLGMTSYMVEQRTKEIAIRKSLGASINSIVKILSKEFTWLVVIANAIGWPIVIWLGSKWLNEFAYKTTISFEIFIIGAFISIIIALITVFTITFIAANSNPSDSLRHE